MTRTPAPRCVHRARPAQSSTSSAAPTGRTGTRNTGLGDEAYDDGDDPVVRVGNVTISSTDNSSTDNSFPDSVTVALIRQMIPKLK